MSAEEFYNTVLNYSKGSPTQKPQETVRSRSMLPIKVKSSSVEKPQLTKTKSNLSAKSLRTNLSPVNIKNEAAEVLKSPNKLLANNPKSHVLGHIPAYLARMRSESKTIEYEFKKKRAELENQGRLLEEMQAQFTHTYTQFKNLNEKYNTICNREEILPKFKVIACVAKDDGNQSIFLANGKTHQKANTKENIFNSHTDPLHGISIENKLRSLQKVGTKLFQEFSEQTLKLFAETKTDVGGVQLLSNVTKLVKEKLSKDEQTHSGLVESILLEWMEVIKRIEATTSKLTQENEIFQQKNSETKLLIEDSKEQFNYDLKLREIEIFNLQNRIEKLEQEKDIVAQTQMNKNCTIDSLRCQLTEKEQQLEELEKSKEILERVLKVRTEVIKELEEKEKGMQQQIEFLNGQVNEQTGGNLANEVD